MPGRSTFRADRQGHRIVEALTSYPPGRRVRKRGGGNWSAKDLLTLDRFANQDAVAENVRVDPGRLPHDDGQVRRLACSLPCIVHADEPERPVSAWSRFSTVMVGSALVTADPDAEECHFDQTSVEQGEAIPFTSAGPTSLDRAPERMKELPCGTTGHRPPRRSAIDDVDHRGRLLGIADDHVEERWLASLPASSTTTSRNRCGPAGKGEPLATSTVTTGSF